MTTPTLANRLAAHPRPVVVDVWAPWCGPCRRIAPLVEGLEAEYAGRVDVWKVNADEQPEAARDLNVLGIPTIVAFNTGREITRQVGAGSEAALRTLFEAARSGERPVRRPTTPLDRALRLAAGTAIILLAASTGPSILLLALGGIVLFAAVADRCPIWQAIWPRVQSLFKRARAKIS